jgi:thymidylate kinase
VNVAHVIDPLLDDTAVVFGSLPPGGRDLDLLVRADQLSELRASLVASGFEPYGGGFVRFRECRADVVELVAATEWGLPVAEVEGLFGSALPFDGLAYVRRPSPLYALLIAARQVRAHRPVPPKLVARARSAIEEDSTALEHARGRARSWRVQNSLARLEDALRHSPAAGGSKRWVVPRRPRWGHLVALSGLDGSGKSTQAEALQEALQTLGHPTVIVWSTLGSNPILESIARPIRRLLNGGRLDARRPSHDLGWDAETGDRSTMLRRRNPVIGTAWATVVVLLHVMGRWRLVLRHLVGGRVVICDRWTLDSLVHLRYAYGDDVRTSLPGAILRKLSPRPAFAYLIEVPPEVAFERTPDYPLERVERRSKLYREESVALGVSILDGARPRDVVCAELQLELFRLLG